jgi:hypothetical protein
MMGATSGGIHSTDAGASAPEQESETSRGFRASRLEDAGFALKNLSERA